MSTVDLSKVILHTAYDSYKNVTKYTGTLVIAGTLAPGSQVITTQSFSVSKTPTYSKLFVNCQEIGDAISGIAVTRWYSTNIPNTFQPAVWCSTPVGNTWLQYGIYIVLFGTSILLRASMFNPYAGNITLTSTNVPFAFIDYTTAQS